MSQVREAITLLSQVLHENGTALVHAETFRQAKFNNDEAVQPLWRLLFELLYFCEYGSVDEVVVKAKVQLTTEELAVYVKQEMQKRGFLSYDFLHLPLDMSTGSRELLLALAWLLCKETVVEKFMEKCTSPLDCDVIMQTGSESPESPCSKLDNSVFMSTKLSPSQRVQQLQVLNGKLRLGLRQLHGLQQEKSSLKHKIHDSTYGLSLSPGREHLSAMEAYMIRHPEVSQRVLELLEKDNLRLHHMLSWRQQEPVFWKWMESVLDLKMKDNLAVGREADYSVPLYLNISSGIVDKMDIARGQLEEAIFKYETIIEQIEDLWETRRSAITQQELDNLLISINMEISLQRANLMLDNTEQMLYKHPNPQQQLQYIGKPSRKSDTHHSLPSLQTHNHHSLPSLQTLSPGSSLGHPVDIETEIARLEHQLETLEDRVSRSQSFYHSKLETMSSEIPDSICIQQTLCR